jgi:hypothetical protein
MVFSILWDRSARRVALHGHCIEILGRTQNIVLALAEVSGTGWITSQCSTTLSLSSGEAMPMTAQDDIVAVGEDTLDLAARLGD